MSQLGLVVAIDQKNGIGKTGDLPWHLPGDLKYFKELTSKTNDPNKINAVFMGRKTWESIPEKFRPLKGRLNVVLTRSKDYKVPEGVIVTNDFVEGLNKLSLSEKIERVFVIGGQQIFEQALNTQICSQLFITHILKVYECDTFLPAYDEHFQQIVKSSNFSDNGTDYYFSEYQRK